MSREETEKKEVESRKEFILETFYKIGTNFISDISYVEDPLPDEPGKWCYIEIKNEEFNTGMQIPLGYVYMGVIYNIPEETMNEAIKEAQEEYIPINN